MAHSTYNYDADGNRNPDTALRAAVRQRIDGRCRTDQRISVSRLRAVLRLGCNSHEVAALHRVDELQLTGGITNEAFVILRK